MFTLLKPKSQKEKKKQMEEPLSISLMETTSCENRSNVRGDNANLQATPATAEKEKKREKYKMRKKKIPDETVESIVVPCVGINKLERNEHSQEKALV